MFLHLSVILFTGRALQEGLCPAGVSVQSGLCLGGSLSKGGLCPGGLCQGDPPTKLRLRAGDTHSTGMHSCLLLLPIEVYQCHRDCSYQLLSLSATVKPLSFLHQLPLLVDVDTDSHSHQLPFLPVANKVCEGYVFTCVCHSGGRYPSTHHRSHDQTLYKQLHW